MTTPSEKELYVLREAFYKEADKRQQKGTAPPCPLMAGTELSEKADQSLLLCDCPSTRAIALKNMGLSACAAGNSCPARTFLGFTPKSADQQ